MNNSAEYQFLSLCNITKEEKTFWKKLLQELKKPEDSNILF